MSGIRSRAEFPWTSHAIAELTRLWDEGLSASKIAAALGTTKGSVVGKAHRLFLPPRPSPLKNPKQRPVGAPLWKRRSPTKSAAFEAEAEAALPVVELEPSQPIAPEAVAEPVEAQETPVLATAPDYAADLAFALLSLPPERAAHDGKRGPRSSFGPPRPAAVMPLHWSEEPELQRCRWPMWGNGERAGRPQRFCTASRRASECYCDRHRAMAYQRVFQIEDEAEPMEDAA